MKPQTATILRYLRAQGSVTQQEAYHAHLGTRLSARIIELRREGYTVLTEWETDGKARWARYRLVEAPVQLAAFG